MLTSQTSPVSPPQQSAASSRTPDGSTPAMVGAPETTTTAANWSLALPLGPGPASYIGETGMSQKRHGLLRVPLSTAHSVQVQLSTAYSVQCW